MAEICECESELNKDNGNIKLQDQLGCFKQDNERIIDDSSATLFLITKMPSINKDIFYVLLIEVLKYCRIDLLKNLDLDINELPIYKSPNPNQKPRS